MSAMHKPMMLLADPLSVDVTIQNSIVLRDILYTATVICNDRQEVNLENPWFDTIQ
jgi:hypothetical protein